MPLDDYTLLCSHLILIYLSYPATYSTVIGQSQIPFSDWSKCIPAARSKARGVGFHIQLDTQMYRLCIVYIAILAVCLLLNCTELCSSQDYIQGPRIIDSRTRHVLLHMIQPSHVVWRSGFHVSPFPPVSITRY